MTRKTLLFALLISVSGRLKAGTAGNSDITIIYAILMGVFALMLGMDGLIKYLNKRRARKEAFLPDDQTEHIS